MTPLRQRMLEDMRVRSLSPHTQRAYAENVARFARHFGRSPADLGPEEIRTYQVYLVDERHLAPSSIEIAVCALRFLMVNLPLALIGGVAGVYLAGGVLSVASIGAFREV